VIHDQAPPPEHHHRRRIPRRLLYRFIALVAIVGTGFAVLRWSPMAQYLNKEEILALFDQLRDTWWAPVLLMLSYFVLCPLGVPATPLMIAGGMVWGVLWGSVYNVIGIFLGAASTYWLGRLLGREFVLHLFGNRLRRVERMVARRGGFWSLAGIRFLPLPFALVNYCAAFVGIRPGLFLGATAMGLSMTVPIFTYFAHALSQAATGDRGNVYVQLGAAMALLAMVILLPRLWQARKRRERYLEVLAARRSRRSGLIP
jgi:phospholipase D1/2